MGNCLPKPKSRKQKKKESGRKKEDDETHEVLSRATEFKKSKKSDPVDMLNALAKTSKHEAGSDTTSKKFTTSRKSTPRPADSKAKSKTCEMSTATIVEVENEDQESDLSEPLAEEASTLPEAISEDEVERMIEDILEEDDVKVKTKVKSKSSVYIGKDMVDGQIKNMKTDTQVRMVSDRRAVPIEKEAEITSDDEFEKLMEQILEEDEALLEAKTIAKQSMSIDVHLDNKQSSTKATPLMSTHHVERLATPSEKKSELDYTEEEEQLMAEILRDDQLNEKKEKAIGEDIKIYDAKRKRTCLELSKKCKIEQRQNSTPTYPKEKRKQKKRLADEDRRKAAKNRRVAEDGI